MEEDALRVTTARGTEGLLAEELDELGLRVSSVQKGGVTVSGGVEEGLRVCMYSRIAMQALAFVGGARVRHAKDVYDAVRSFSLTRHFTADHTIAVWSAVRGEGLMPSHALSLRVKDAIVDAMRDEHGRRPFVETGDPDIGVQVYLDGNELRFYLRLQGAPLHHRGYRLDGGEAPVRENIAAALLRFAEWDGREPLHDFMCGSGTFVIEAAQMACGIAPGLQRSFGFQRWPSWEERYRPFWEKLVAEATEARIPRAPGVIMGSDSDRRALQRARANAGAAGVGDSITFHEAGVEELRPMIRPGLVLANPPWGERLGASVEEAKEIHERIGERARTLYGHRLALFSTPEALDQTVKLRTERTQAVRNGPIDCRMVLYRIHELDSAATAEEGSDG